MAKQHSMSGQGLHQIKKPVPLNETAWQQLMLFNYLLFETLEAMAQERANGQPTPLNDHWQQFAYHLRLHRPKLGECLDKLLTDLEGLQ